MDGVTLADSQFRKHFDAIVVAIMDVETDSIAFNPNGDVALTPGDTLVVLGSAEMVQRLREEGCTALLPTR
ncbi:MAG: K+/H+ antiporter YhaU regulatory subunit KhtT [Rhodothermales bacterium]